MATLPFGLRERWDGLSERERLLVGGLGVALVLVVMMFTGFVIGSGLTELEEENADLRQALKDIDAGRDAYLRARSKLSQVEAKMGHGGVQLQGLLEAAAKDSEVDIAESNERAPVTVAKKYIERAVDLRVRKVGVSQLAAFLKRIETGSTLALVTQLAVRVRDDKHEDLEVDMTVSTWERAVEQKPGKKGAATDKPAKENKG